MKIYIAGPITGIENYKELFAVEEKKLLDQGHCVMNPAVLPAGFTHEDYMGVCYSMMDVCDRAHFLKGWERSKGAQLEMLYAKETGMLITITEVSK